MLYNLKKILLFFSVLCVLSVTYVRAQVLNQGDLAVVGWNSVSDKVHLVALVDIPVGTVIKITDRGWDRSTNAFVILNPSNTGDGIVTWTLSTAVSAGTVLELFLGGSDEGTSLTNLTTSANLTTDIVTTGYLAADVMPGTGDQIFIYQGADNNPFFIFGLNNSGGPVDANNWNNNYEVSALFVTLRDSYLPNNTGSQNALTNGVNAIGLRTANNQEDNVQYIGPIGTADRNTWLARITERANWGGSDVDGTPSNPITAAPIPKVNITAANNSPTDINLSNASVNYSGGVNAVVGTFSTTDADVGDTHSYSLVSGAGSTHNASFNISGNTLRANSAAALAAGTYSVRIQTEDNGGGAFQKIFTITVVDDVAPTVSSVTVPANATYIAGQNLDFTINVSKSVTVTGTPQLSLIVGSTAVNATYNAGGSTSTALLFRYTVQAGDADSDGITVSSIHLNSGTIRDGANLPLTLTLNNVGNTDGVWVDGVAPLITSVDVPSDGTYIIGETLNFTVNFNETVIVNTSGGTPRFPLTIGTVTRYAEYWTGSGTNALVFSYTIGGGENDSDGIAVGSSIALNGGAISDNAGNMGTLVLAGMGSTTAILVDGSAPLEFLFSPLNGATNVTPNANLSITFNENIILGTGNIIVYDDAATPIVTIDVANHGGQLSIANNVLTINPTADLLEMTHYYVKIGNNVIHDLAGNTYPGISNNTKWAFTTADVTPPSGYVVSIDQTAITLANHTSLSFTFMGAEIGAIFDYKITSSGGGTPVTGSGTITSASQQVANMDVSGLANGALTLSVTLTDASGNVGNPATDDVTKAVNYPPVITTSGGVTAFTGSEHGAPVPVAIDPALTVSDPDNTTLVSAMVRITGNFLNTQDLLGWENDGNTMGNISASYNAGTGVLTLTSAGAMAFLAEWQSALRAVTYNNSSTNPNTANRTLSFVINDGVGNSAEATKTVSITAVNNAPVLTNLNGDVVTFTEGGPAVLIDAGGDATVSDSDSPDFDGGNLTVAFVAGSNAGEDVLGIRNEGTAAGQIGVSGADVTYGGTTIGMLTGGTGGIDLIVTFLPTSTPVAAQALIRNLTYSNSNNTNPSVDPRAIRITLADGDGAESWPNIVTVNIIPVNDAPIVTTSGGTTTFTESISGDPVPVAIDPALTVTDPDNTTLASAMVRITGNFLSAQDLLGWENDGNTMGNISAGYNAGTGVLTLTSAGATATLAEWQTALQAVTYSNSSANPSTANRTVSFVINDGIDDSNSATKNILVVAVNTAPVAVDDYITVTEDIPSTGNVLTNDSDVEENALTASLVIAPVNGTVVLNADGSFTYTPNHNFNGQDSLTYQVCDNGVPTRCDNAMVYFTVLAVNDAPTITAPTAIAVEEDVATAFRGISFSDVDAGNANVTVTLGVGSGKLLANLGAGVVVSGSETMEIIIVGSISDINTFIEAGNLLFVTDSDATEDVTLTVHIDDNGYTGAVPVNSQTASTTVQVLVTAINDAPVNHVPSDQAIDQDEPLIFSTANQNVISVSDVDAGNGIVRITLNAVSGLLNLPSTSALNFIVGSGANDATMTFEGTLIDINQALGGLIFQPTPGYIGAASLQIITDDLGLSGVGGGKLAVDVIDIAVNPTSPMVVSVGATSADQVYGIGESVTLTVTFDKPVVVDVTGGRPSLNLETGGVGSQAEYRFASDLHTLVFNYVVQSGDVSADLDYVSRTALQLNGGIIESVVGKYAILELPVVGGANSIAGQHGIEIDGIAPVARAKNSTLELGADGVAVLTVADLNDGSFDNRTAVGDLLLTISQASFGCSDIGDVPVMLSAIDAAGNKDSTVAVVTVKDVTAPIVKTRNLLVALGADGKAFITPGMVDNGSNDACGIATLELSKTEFNKENLGTNFVQLMAKDHSGNESLEFAKIEVIAFDDSSFVYDGTAKSLKVVGELPVGVNVIYVGNGQTEAGAYTVKAIIDGGGVYENMVLSAGLEVVPALLQDVVSFDDASYVYDGSSRSLAVVGLPAGARVTYVGNDRTGAGRYTVTAIIDGGTNYEDLILTAELTIERATITGITFDDASFVYDGSSRSLAVAGLPVGAAVKYVGNGQTEAGEYVVTATVDAGDNYIRGLSKTAKLTILPLQQVLIFSAITPVGRDAGTLLLDIQSNSELPIQVFSDNLLVAEVKGASELLIKGVGQALIRAEQAGDSNHIAAQAVEQILEVVNDRGGKLPVRVHPAVSPNGDGINEFLRIEGIEQYPENKFVVFDANGAVIQRFEGYDNASTIFDGTKAGRPVPNGTYFYVLEVKIAGKWEYDKGYFVVRK